LKFDLTRQSLFTTIFYFILLMAVFWGGSILGGVSIESGGEAQSYGTPLGALIDQWFVQWPLLGIVLSSFLVFTNSLLVTRLTIRHLFFMEKSYMPALVYLIISSGYYNSYLSFRPLLASLVILMACGILLNSYSKKELASGSFLTVGFCFGVAVSLYSPAAYLAPLIFIGLIQFRLFDIREWLAALAGLLLPLAMSVYIVWLAGGDAAATVSGFIRTLLTDNNTIPALREVTPVQWTFIATVIVTFLFAVGSFTHRRPTGNFKPIKAFVFFLWMALITLGLILFAPCRSIYQLPLVAMPLAVIIPAYFNGRKPSLVSNFLYAMLILSAIAIHIVPLLNINWPRP